MERPAKAAKKLVTTPPHLADSLSDGRLASHPTSSPRYPGTIRAATQIALVRALLEERKLRNQFLPEKVLGDAAWNILLTLYLGRCEDRMTAINTLTDTTAAPRTTVLRWTVALANLDLVSRHTNADDRRITEVRLTVTGLDMIESYFSALHHLRA